MAMNGSARRDALAALAGHGCRRARDRRLGGDRRHVRRRDLADRCGRPGRDRPPAAGRQGLRRRAVRDQRQARPRDRRHCSPRSRSARLRRPRRRVGSRSGALGFAAFGAVGLLAALGEPLASPAIVAVQAAAGTGVAIQTLSWLLGSARPGRWRRRARPGPPIVPLAHGRRGLGALAAGAFGRVGAGVRPDARRRRPRPCPGPRTPSRRWPPGPTSRRRRRASRRSSSRTTTSTGSTRRSSSRPSTPRHGSCGSTAWSNARRR